jgi:hypothetical protein
MIVENSSYFKLPAYTNIQVLKSESTLYFPGFTEPYKLLEITYTFDLR